MFYVCIVTEIETIAFFVANLLVLPFLGTVSTSGLHLTRFLKSDNVDAGKRGSGVPWHIAAAAEIALIWFPSQSYVYFRYTSVILEFPG